MLGTRDGPNGRWDLRAVYDLFPGAGRARARAPEAMLSGGQQQMLAIGRALMANPGLLLLDEPSEGLSPVLVDELVGALNEIRRAGTGVLVVEQHLSLVKRATDRFVILSKGQIVGAGPTRRPWATPESGADGALKFKQGKERKHERQSIGKTRSAAGRSRARRSRCEGAAHAEDTIKIGALLIDSGPLAGLKDRRSRRSTSRSSRSTPPAAPVGKKFEADFISYPGTPDTAVDGATRAVQKDGALFLTGMDTSAVSPALSAKLAVAQRADDRSLRAGRRPDRQGLQRELLPRQRQRLHDHERGRAVPQGQSRSRSGTSSPSTIPPAATPPTKFQALVKSQGGSIGKVLFAPSGTADFGAKISELGADPAEGLYVTIFGSDAINLAKQQAQFGLFGKYKMVIGNSFIIPQVLPAMGDTTVGVYQTLGFVAGEPGAQAEAFVKAYKEKYDGQVPAYTSADQYAAIQLMAAAINKANSTDVAAVRAALSGLKTDTVLGNVQVRAEDHQTARPILMNQIVKTADGKAGYEIKTIFPGDALMPPVDPACKM